MGSFHLQNPKKLIFSDICFYGIEPQDNDPMNSLKNLPMTKTGLGGR